MSVPAALPSPRQLWAGWRGGKELPLTARAGKDKLCPEHPARLCQGQAPGCAQPRRAARAAPLLPSLSPSASPDNTGMIAAQQDTGQGSGGRAGKAGRDKAKHSPRAPPRPGPFRGSGPLVLGEARVCQSLAVSPSSPRCRQELCHPSCATGMGILPALALLCTSCAQPSRPWLHPVPAQRQHSASPAPEGAGGAQGWLPMKGDPPVPAAAGHGTHTVPTQALGCRWE